MKFLAGKSNLFIFVFLFVLAFIVRGFFMIYFDFDGLYGQDAYAYYDLTKQFIASVSAFHIPPRFYWPVGYFIFSSLMCMVSFGSIGAGTILLSLISGSLLASVMYLLSLELLKNIFSSDESRKLSLISGLIICFSGAAVKSAIVIMSDALGLLLLACGMLYLARYFKSFKRYQIVVSFVFFSLGAMTRYADFLIAIPVLIILAYLYRQSSNRRKLAKDFLFALAAAVIVFTPEMYYISGYGISYLNYEGATGTWASAWNPLNYLKKDFITFDGAQHYKLWNGIYLLAPSFHPAFISLFGLAFVWGVISAIRKKYTVIILFCFNWFIIYYLYLAGNPFQSIRYTLSFLPALICVSAFGIGSIKLKDRIKNIYITTGILLLFAYAFYDINGFSDRKNKELEVVSYVKSNIPQNSLLFTFEITGAVNHYMSRVALEFFNYDIGSLKQKIDSESKDIYFILPLENFTKQWKDRPIEKTFNYLTANYTLQHAGTVNNYVILKLKK